MKIFIAGLFTGLFVGGAFTLGLWNTTKPIVVTEPPEIRTITVTSTVVVSLLGEREKCLKKGGTFVDTGNQNVDTYRTYRDEDEREYIVSCTVPEFNYNFSQ